MSYSQEQIALLAVLHDAVANSRLPLDTEIHGIVKAWGDVPALEAVAIEAAAMLAETNHGGLTHARSESMKRALVAAGVEIPAGCSECPEHENMKKAST